MKMIANVNGGINITIVKTCGRQPIMMGGAPPIKARL